MAHGTRIVLAVFAAVGAVVLWFALTYGVVLALGSVIDPGALSDNARTALTTGVLGAALAGAVFAGMVSFFLVAGEARADGRARGDGAG
jgi:hypothetical protein